MWVQTLFCTPSESWRAICSAAVEHRENTGRLTADAAAAYEAARQRAQIELSTLEDRLLPHAPAQAKIMAAHRDILFDPAMDEEIRTLIEQEHLSPNAAAAQVYDCYAELLGASKNELMKERCVLIS